MSNKHIGSSFNDFLEEEGIHEEVEVVTVKRVLAYEIARIMQNNSINKAEMTDKLQTSRSQLNCLLDPENTSVTLATMQKAAIIVGKKLKVELA